MADPAAGERTILVVSDDPQVVAEARFSFPDDVDVRFARDARDAGRTMESDPPAAVIVDMQTGNAGGYSLATDMRFDDRLRSVPVIILLERAQDAWLARQAGASAYLVKPVIAADLAAATLALG
jgi:chemosensory pili system protein ChpA (sensor histidine kinase/response regulator)